MKNSVLKKLTWTLILAVFLASILPNIFSNYWFIDIFSNFKFQYLILAILLLFVSLFIFQKKTLALITVGLSILYNAYFIAPYYFSKNDHTLKNSKQFTVTSINLLSTNSKTALVKNYISEENPDILILLEFTNDWQQELHPIIEQFPFKKLISRNDNFGIALLSKYEMKSSVDYFNPNSKPSIVGELTIDNERVTIVATHPIPPINQATFENRNNQFSGIIENRSRFHENLIIAGDFNTSSFSNHFNKLTIAGLRDSRIGFGLLPTWPASFQILQTTLDHFVVSKSLIVIERSAGRNIGSDHLPVNATIGFD